MVQQHFIAFRHGVDDQFPDGGFGRLEPREGVKGGGTSYLQASDLIEDGGRLIKRLAAGQHADPVLFFQHAIHFSPHLVRQLNSGLHAARLPVCMMYEYKCTCLVHPIFCSMDQQTGQDLLAFYPISAQVRNLNVRFLVYLFIYKRPCVRRMKKSKRA